MVEDVEGLGTELKGRAFLDREVFEEAHIEGDARRIAHVIAPRVSEGESGGQSKGAGVNAVLGIGWPRDLISGRDPAGRAANQIWERARTGGIADTGVVTVSGAVRHGNRYASRERLDTGPLPPTEQGMGKTGLLEQRDVVDPTGGQQMPLVKVGTGAGQARIVGCLLYTSDAADE